MLRIAMTVLTNVMHGSAEVKDISAVCLWYRDGSMTQIKSSVVYQREERGCPLITVNLSVMRKEPCYTIV